MILKNLTITIILATAVATLPFRCLLAEQNSQLCGSVGVGQEHDEFPDLELLVTRSMLSPEKKFMSALYLTRDLLFSSRVSSAAADCSLDMTIVSDDQELLTRVAAGGIHFVLIDFSTPDLHLLALVPQLRQVAPTPISVVAYGPHVDVAGMAGARQAGCNAVYTRGQFDGQIAKILRQYGCAT